MKDQLTESKRRIITLLKKGGDLTKRQLTQSGQMGWATVVKAINQLIEEGIVIDRGISEDSIGKIGKDALAYSLSREKPMAIGVDIEIRTTRIVLVNLNGDILADEQYPTPQPVDLEGSRKFLEESIKDFAAKNAIDLSTIDGIGIGKAGITFPSLLHVDDIRASRKIARYLNSVFNTLVRIDTNSKVYAVFEKWANAEFDYNDFMIVTMRSGIGNGIIVKGNLYEGTHGLSGEIGHMKVVPNGAPCRCGGSGCMETVVNQYYLYEQYRTAVLKDTTRRTDDNIETLKEGLSDLFSRAKAGEEAAFSIIKTAAGYLGYCIANAITVLDISNIILSGHFGPDGDVIEPLLAEEIRKNILTNMEFSIRYMPFEPNGYVRGAALLILKDYLVDVPQEAAGA